MRALPAGSTKKRVFPPSFRKMRRMSPRLPEMQEFPPSFVHVQAFPASLTAIRAFLPSFAKIRTFLPSFTQMRAFLPSLAKIPTYRHGVSQRSEHRHLLFASIGRFLPSFAKMRTSPASLTRTLAFLPSPKKIRAFPHQDTTSIPTTFAEMPPLPTTFRPPSDRSRQASRATDRFLQSLPPSTPFGPLRSASARFGQPLRPTSTLFGPLVEKPFSFRPFSVSFWVHRMAKTDFSRIPKVLTNDEEGKKKFSSRGPLEVSKSAESHKGTFRQLQR